MALPAATIWEVSTTVDADKLIETMRRTGRPTGPQLFDPRSEGHCHGKILLYIMPDRSAVAVVMNPEKPRKAQLFRHIGPDVDAVRKALTERPIKGTLRRFEFERVC